VVRRRIGDQWRHIVTPRPASGATRRSASCTPRV
jgi:hypothetical protein